MPKNPFIEFQNYESRPNRNSFDLSHSNHLTMKFGGLYPVLVQEVNTGDSFSINASFGLRMMPMVFPVQTPINASLHFFYVRNRNLWRDWEDFIYNNRNDLVHPYIAQPSGSFWKTGSLADYMGVPTTYARQLDNVSFEPFNRPPVFYGLKSDSLLFGRPFSDMYTLDPLQFIVDQPYVFYRSNEILTISDLFSFDFVDPYILPIYAPQLGIDYAQASISLYEFDSSDPLASPLVIHISGRFSSEGFVVSVITWNSFDGESTQSFSSDNFEVFLNNLKSFSSRKVVLSLSIIGHRDDMNAGNTIPSNYWAYHLAFRRSVLNVTDLSEISENPFAGSLVTAPQLPINALPFRAYEAIYNTYYRDMQNDPFVLHGQTQYNTFISNDNGGADNTNYHLFYRNWEKDYLTSCLPSPQQGVAPLIGITQRGVASFLNLDTGEISEVQMKVENNGDITGVEGFRSNATIGAARSALDLAASGISINDIRQVGGLTRWLENNIRRGLRYPEQVLANTGVKIKYDALDMPEFLGGFSRPVVVTSVTQSTPSTSDDNALGDVAGQATLFGKSNHNVTRFCDEAGWIIGILCVTPVPVYTQNLSKKFLKTDALSYYHSAFNHIGMQPVPMSEVAPVQAAVEGVSLSKTFGYQRPWYDLIANVDSAHGKMRTDMRDFIMNRTFSRAPELGADFLHVDPAQLNQVFSITDPDEDVIMGQVYFQMYAKRPISRFGIPRLEA